MLAGDIRDVSLQAIKTAEIKKGNTKAPTRPIVITLEDNVITLPATPVDYTLELRDESGTLLYSAYQPTGTTQVTLPTSLSGGFELRLVADTYYYIGYIEL